MKYKQYSVVRLKEIKKQFTESESYLGTRLPKVGDIATIVEIYESPTLGYELECENKDGSANWLLTFSPEDAIFELISESA